MPGSGGSRSARRWTRWLLLLVLAAGFWRILFLGNLDIGKQSSLLTTWKTNFYERRQPSGKTNSLGRAGLFDGLINSTGTDDPSIKVTGDPVDDICEAWLEKEDRFTYSRNFSRDPIWVVGEEKDWSTCSVGCVFTSSLTSERKPDAGFGYRGDAETASVLRSMESSHYYPENDIAVARGWERVQCYNDNQSLIRRPCRLFFVGRI